MRYAAEASSAVEPNRNIENVLISKFCNSVPPTEDRWASPLHITDSDDELEKMKWNDIHIRGS